MYNWSCITVDVESWGWTWEPPMIGPALSQANLDSPPPKNVKVAGSKKKTYLCMPTTCKPALGKLDIDGHLCQVLGQSLFWVMSQLEACFAPIPVTSESSGRKLRRATARKWSRSKSWCTLPRTSSAADCWRPKNNCANLMSLFTFCYAPNFGGIST